MIIEATISDWKTLFVDDKGRDLGLNVFALIDNRFDAYRPQTL